MYIVQNSCSMVVNEKRENILSVCEIGLAQVYFLPCSTSAQSQNSQMVFIVYLTNFSSTQITFFHGLLYSCQLRFWVLLLE